MAPANLTAASTGTAHVFIWDTMHDLGATDNPSVQVRITPSDAVGVEDTVVSSPFAANNSGVVNALTITFNDANNDVVTLAQTGSTIRFSGSLDGGSQNLVGTATNLTSLTVVGGPGQNRLDASAVQMPVTLNTGNSRYVNTLIGGAGDDIVVDTGLTGSIYDGGGGQ